LFGGPFHRTLVVVAPGKIVYRLVQVVQEVTGYGRKPFRMALPVQH